MTSQNPSFRENAEAAARTVVEAREIVQRLTRSLCESFDLVAKKGPDLEARLSSLTDRLSDVSSQRFFESFAHRTGTTRDAFANLDQSLERTGGRATGLVEQLSGLENNTNHIHSKLEEVVELSDNLTLVALNARMLSSAAGTSGAAFGAITQELTGASREVSAVAREFIGAMQGIERRLSELHDIQQRLTETLSHVNLDAIHQVVSDAQQCHEAVSSINRHAEQSGTLCNSVRPLIGELMGMIQRQDILSQSLEHISAVGTELEEQVSVFGSQNDADEQVASRIAFVSQGALLSRELLMDTSKELLGFLGRVEELLGRLETIAESLASLDELRTVDLQVAESARGGIEDLAGALSALDDLDEAVSCSEKASQANSQELRQVSKVLSRMKKLSETVSVIEVVMRIKTASNAVLEKDAQFLAKEIRAGQEKISAALDSVHEDLRSIDSMSQNDTLGAFRASFSELRQARARTDELKDQLSGFTDELSGILGQAVAEGGHLRAHLDDFRRNLDDFKSRIAEISTAATSLELIASLAAQKAESLGLEPSKEAVSGRLEELVDRFTVLSQKIIAGSATEIEVENGDAEGSLTLF